MDELYFWRTENQSVFEIAGQLFDLDTKGIDYAKQFGRLAGWLGTHGLAGLMSAYDEGVIGTSDLDSSSGIMVLGYLVEHGVTPEALIDLGAIVLGCEPEFAEENFDPGWLVDGVMLLLEIKPGIKAAVMRLWDRFFLASESDAGAEEDQA